MKIVRLKRIENRKYMRKKYQNLNRQILVIPSREREITAKGE